jgi:hypothetical protein
MKLAFSEVMGWSKMQLPKFDAGNAGGTWHDAEFDITISQPRHSYCGVALADAVE